MKSTSPTRFAVAYYPEHWPKDRWETDFKLMQACGISLVRMAEFAWSAMQPGEDTYRFEWLDEAIELAAKYELEVMLCTPSACPPAWVVDRFPDLLPQLQPNHSFGPVLGLGHRRHYSPFHEGFAQAAADMTRVMGERYGQHDNVISWQIDNELCGILQDHGPLAQSAFQSWLKSRHGDLESLNDRLGHSFWGQHFNRWEQIPVPAAEGQQPALRAEWRRCVSDAWVSWCRKQADALRPHVGERPITTNCYLFRWGCEIDWWQLMREGGIDVFGFDNYTRTPHESGFYNDLGASLSSPYWILEQPAGHPLGQHMWPQEGLSIKDHVSHAVEHGADVVSYFRWRQPLSGSEQDHGAVLDHHGKTGPTWQAVTELANYAPPSPSAPEIGCVFDWEDQWLAGTGAVPMDYSGIMIEDIYRACHAAGQRVRFYPKTAPDFSDVSVLMVPLLLTLPDALGEALASFVEGGGTLISFPLLGVKDTWNNYEPEAIPTRMAELLGIKIKRKIPCQQDVFAEVALSANTETVRLGRWLEDVELDTAESLAPFGETENLSGQPAVTRRVFGSGGAAIHIAGYPDFAGLRALIAAVRD